MTSESYLQSHKKSTTNQNKPPIPECFHASIALVKELTCWKHQITNQNWEGPLGRTLILLPFCDGEPHSWSSGHGISENCTYGTSKCINGLATPCWCSQASSHPWWLLALSIRSHWAKAALTGIRSTTPKLNYNRNPSNRNPLRDVSTSLWTMFFGF